MRTFLYNTSLLRCFAFSFFYHERVLNIFKCFFCINFLILYLIIIVYYIIRSTDVKTTYIPRISPTFSWCTILFIYCWIWFIAFYWRFLYLFIFLYFMTTDLQFSYLLLLLSLFSIRITLTLWNELWSMKSFGKLKFFSFGMLVEFTSEEPETGIFFVRSIYY